LIITIDNVIHEHIRRHAVAAYPEECCGLLFGQEDCGFKFVRGLKETQNVAEDSRQSRYLIAPADLFEAEGFVRERGWDVIGVYHSHPDHPARPSQFDREHAILHYSYIIVSVMGGEVVEWGCWTLRDWGEALDPDEIRISGAKRSARIVNPSGSGN
jgi:proteasome lid subunit RPN8/RPN11